MKDTFRVGDRVRVNDSCQWVSLRGEVGTITKDCGGFVFTVDFGGGCFDLKVTDFEPKHPNGCDCGGFDRNGSHSAGEYVGYCEFQDDEDDAPVTSTVATEDVLIDLRGSQHDEELCSDDLGAGSEMCVRVPTKILDRAASEIERLRGIIAQIQTACSDHFERHVVRIGESVTSRLFNEIYLLIKNEDCTDAE